MRRLTIVAHALMLVLVLRMIGVMLLQRSVILFFFFWVNLKNVKLFNLIFLCFCHITTAKLHLLLKTKTNIKVVIRNSYAVTKT